MWVAAKKFYFRGKTYRIGDVFDSPSLTAVSGLRKLKRIRQVDGEVPVKVVLVPIYADGLVKLNRTDLNAQASLRGISDPTSFNNKADLIAAIAVIDSAAGGVTDDGTGKDSSKDSSGNGTGSEGEGSTDEKSSDETDPDSSEDVVESDSTPAESSGTPSEASDAPVDDFFSDVQ